MLPWGKVGTGDDGIRQLETRARLVDEFSTLLCCVSEFSAREARMERTPALLCGAQSLHIQLVCIPQRDRPHDGAKSKFHSSLVESHPPQTFALC
jgi:hypothetical protein